MEEETYTKKVGCKNCRRDQVIKIPKGTTVKEYVEKNKKCPNCGCEELFAYAN